MCKEELPHEDPAQHDSLLESGICGQYWHWLIHDDYTYMYTVHAPLSETTGHLSQVATGFMHALTVASSVKILYTTTMYIAFFDMKISAYLKAITSSQSYHHFSL